MDYQKIYNKLISRCRVRENFEEYVEKHHVMPDFFFINRKRKGPKGHLPGDPDAASNKVFMTPREHLLAHLLLCKIHRGTRYEYGCLGSLALMLNASEAQIDRSLVQQALGKSRVYAKARKDWSNIVSHQFKNTIVAKDVKTGEMIGHVPCDHPNVISGKWVHHTKGTKLTKSHRDKISIATTGLSNGNSKGYTDNDLLDSYLECAKVVGFLPTNNIWLGWAQSNNQPYLKFFKQFRFNGNGLDGLRKIAEERSNMKFDAKIYTRLDTRELYNNAKEKWVN